MLLGLSLCSDVKSNRWLAMAIVLVDLVALLVSHSLGGWLALTVGAIVLVVLLSKKTKQRLVIAGLGLVLGAAALAAFNWTRLSALANLSAQSSLTVRLQVWQTALSLIRQHGLTGIGPDAFEAKYLLAARELLGTPLETYMLHSHNLWLQTILNAGLVGLVGMVWLWLRLVGWGLRLGAQGAYLLAALSAIFVHGLVDTTYWKNDLAMVFWLIAVSLAMLYSHSRQRVSQLNS
jgi:O-antigen ligase